MTIERPEAVADELRADLRAHVVHDRETVELAIGMLRDYQRLLDRKPGIDIHPGAVTVTPAPTPADIARALGRRIADEHLPTAMRTPRADPGQITERDRFFDEANDRRTALAAAARVLAGPDRARAATPVEVTDLSATLLDHLRKGKPTA